MATNQLIAEDCIEVDKSLLPLDPCYLPAAIDCGSALIKLAYLQAYSTECEQPGRFRLNFALFDGSCLDAALEFLRAKILPAAAENRLMRATGIGAKLHGDKIRDKLGVDIEVADEAKSHAVGLSFLVKHCPTSDICHPPPAIDEAEFAGLEHGETFQKFRDAQTAMMGEQHKDSKFPVLLIVYGSTANVLLVHEDGSSEERHSCCVAGKSALGLCRLLAGTGDYQEIMRLTETGKRGNIDTQIKDVLADSPDSPYGRIPLSIGVFAFGKAVDFDKSIEETRPEDIAQSLVSTFTSNIAFPVSQLATYDKVRNIYYGGNFFRHEYPRAEVIRATTLFAATEAMNMKFLKISHTAALGAMLASTTPQCK